MNLVSNACKAEPLAETPVETIDNAAFTASGLFLPGDTSSELPVSLYGQASVYNASSMRDNPVAATELLAPGKGERGGSQA